MNTFLYKHLLKPSLILLCALGMASPIHAVSHSDKNWEFKVYLDGDEIGFHHFSLIRNEDHHEIHSNASFDVKFLFFNAYSYRHNNVEHWNGQCLTSINAMTDDNGDLYDVSGNSAEDGFIVSTRENEESEKQNRYLPCIKTFAYWDPQFMKETSLLNSQTGEMISVASKFIGEETLLHDGDEITTKRYRLNGEDLQIDLWYSDDDHWLALESLTESGHVIRYALP